jgi:hypothetical protein
MPRLSPDSDRGAVSTIVVMLLATGVLLGMTAMVVDVGQLYAEREELQSGADSAAMTVALDCVKRRPACPSLGMAKAEEAADANASDGRADVEEFCGRDARAALPTCLSYGDKNLADCIGSAPEGVNFVQVRTRTEVASDDYVLPFAFAQSMTGVAEGATVGACSRVAYGPPRFVLGLTISACEYERTRHNSVAGPPWPPDPPAHREVQLGDHDHTSHFCPAVPPRPGWGWPNDVGMFDDTDGSCVSQVEDDLDYRGVDVHLPSLECRNQLARLRSTRQVVAVPIIRGERGSGSTTRYDLYRLAAFVVTGYSMPGFSAPSTVNPGFGDCHLLEICIFGYFIDLDFFPGEVGPDPGIDLGLVAIKTIG